jgi:cell wall-associated NlpC family hydrolase
VAGAIVLFRLGSLPRHCGILVSPTRFIHAQERIGVVEVNLTEGWAKRVAGCFAFPEIL